MLVTGDCRERLREVPSGTVGAVICDPICPEVGRADGRLSEGSWHSLMHTVVGEVRRILKPDGSAVFILQPGHYRTGSVRPWLFAFQAWVCEHWNMVQDVWW